MYRGIMILAALWVAALVGAQTPQLSYDLPAEALVNSEFCFDSSLTNTGAPGYGPYLRILLEPGFDLVSAETLSGGSTQVIGVFDASGTLNDPLTGDVVSGSEGGSFALHQLPVGSVVAGGPELVTTLCLQHTALSPSQDDVTSLEQSYPDVDALRLQPVYEFGDTATGANGPVIGASLADNLNLVEALYSFEEDSSENDNPPGPGYPQTYELTVDIAEGRGLEPQFSFDIPADEIPDESTLSVSGAGACSVTTTPGGGAPNGTFTLDCSGNPVTGSAAATDIAISFDYYIRPNALDTATCPAAAATTADAKHLTAEKSVSSGLVSPGDVLTFTIGFEVSVDATLNALTLSDTLPDGLDFDETSVTLAFDQVNRSLVSGVDFTFGVSGGVTTASYDLRALNAQDFPPNSGGSLTYQATVLESYAGGSPLLAADTLGSAAAEATYNTSGGASGCTDGTNVAINVRPVNGDKAVVRINLTPVSGAVEVSPGDDVTYRLIMNVPSGDTRDIVFEDFFPLPVFDASGLTAADITVAGAAAVPPGPDNVGAAPTNVTTNAAQNSLRFEVADVSSNPSAPRTLAYDVTLTASDDPFADGLILANLFQHQTQNSANETNSEVQPVAFTMRTPELTLDKRAVSVAGNGSVSGENVSGADAGDEITFELTATNIGGAEAYGVTLTDDAETAGYGSCTIDQIITPDGTILAGVLGSFSGDLFGSGLTLSSLESVDSGESIVVTYTCSLPQSLQPEATLTNTAAVTEYYGSSGAVGTPSKNYVAKYGPLEDNTTLSGAGGSVSKTRVSTSETATSGANVAIGEVVTYDIVYTFPEGTIQNAALIDLAQQNGSGNLELLSAQVTAVGANLSWTGQPATLPSSLSFTAAGFNLALGTVSNTGTNDSAPGTSDQITVRVTARVTDAAANVRGNTPTNRGRLAYERANGSSAQVTNGTSVTIVEPQVRVTKTVSSATADAGDTLTFTLRLEHTATSNAAAFDLALSDSIPPGLSYAGGLTDTAGATVSASSLSDNGGAGPVTASYASLLQGEVGEISFQVTVDASVNPEQGITNVAELDYYSLADEADPNRRLYEASGNRVVTISGAARSKSLVTSSLGNDASERVAVGEVLTFEIVTTLPEGEIQTLVIEDADLDTNEVLSLLDGEVIAIGGVTTSGARQGGSLSASGGGDLPAAVSVGAAVAASGGSVSFNFGDVRNLADGSETAGDTITVRVRGVVANGPANAAGDTLTNTATVSYGPSGSRINRPTSLDLTVLEPDLSLNKAAVTVTGAGSLSGGNVTGADAGDVIEYEITVTHDGTAAAGTDTPAFDLELSDTLPTDPAVSYNSDASFSADCGAPTAASAGSGTLEVSVGRLDAGESCTISYSVTVDAGVNPSTSDNNSVSLSYASTPGAAEEDARSYSETPQTASLTVADPGLSKTLSATSLGGDTAGRVAVGEVLSYDLIITLPEGESTNLVLSDSETDPDGTLTLLSGEVISVGGVSTAGATAGGQLSGSSLAVGDTVSPSSGVLTFTFGNLSNATGGSAEDSSEDQIVVRVRARVAASDADNAAGVTLTNTASLSYGSAGSVTATADVSVLEPDLTLEKRAVSVTGAGSVNADGNVISADIGDVVTYTLSAVHNGSAATNTDTPAYALSFGDTLPANPATSFLAAASFSAGCGGATATTAPGSGGADVTFTVESLAVGATCTVTYTAEVTSGGAGASDNNTASLNFDTVPGAGDEAARTMSTADADASLRLARPVLGVAKALSTAGAPQPSPNADGTFDLSYLFTVENLGDVALDTVQVSDDLSAAFPGVTVDVISVSATGSLTANTVAGFETTGDLLDAATSGLAVGASETIMLELRLDPDGALGTFENQATASANSPGGVAAAGDLSDNGTNPDGDGDGNPNETDSGGGADADSDENDPTPVILSETSVIGVAKRVSIEGVTFAGVYTLRYEYLLENLGNVDLSSVQLRDDLTRAFTDPPLPAGTTYRILDLTVEAVLPTPSVSLSPNATFDGDPDAAGDALLDASSSALSVGAVNRVVLRLELDPADVTTTFINQATGTALGPNGTLTTDLSDEGTEPDEDGDGNPNEDATDPGNPDADSPENTPTDLTLVESPIIGVAKEAGTVTDNQDGSYTLPITLRMGNYGNIDLVNLSLRDDLTAAFPGVPYAVSNVSASAGLTLNAGFTGDSADPSGSDLLAGSDTLYADPNDGPQTGSVSFDLTLFPTTTTGAYLNQALASAQSPGGATTSDLSDNGADPDGDGDGLPNEQASPYDQNQDGATGAGEGVVTDSGGPGDGVTADNNDPTPISFTEQAASLGLAKDISSSPVNNADGTYTLEYSLYAENLGGVELRNLSITDDLAVTFGAALVSAEALDGVDGPGLTGLSANPDYDGVSDTEVLSVPAPPDQSQELAVGETGTLRLRVTVEPGTDLGPYLNSASARATSPGGQTPTDLSDSGSEPDADGDGLGNEQLTPFDADGNGVVAPGEGVEADAPGDGLGNDLSSDENDPTPVSFSEAPALGVAKRFVGLSAVDPVTQPGVFEVVLEFTIQNLGDIEVRNVQLNDDLNAAFRVADGSSYQVTSLSARNGRLTPVDAATLSSAAGNSDLLVGTDTLAQGAGETLTLTATVTPFDPGADYSNQATVSAVSPAGTSLSDLSDDGADPDGDGDGNPSENGPGCADDPAGADCEDDPTPFKFESPAVGLAKAAEVTNNGDGTYSVTYTFILENLGDVTLNALSLQDDLGARFGNTLLSARAVDGLATASVKGLRANPGYDGVSDTEILAPNQTLDSDVRTPSAVTLGTLSVTALVRPGANLGPYTNSAVAAGNSPGGQRVEDISDEGSVPDTDGDGNANEEDTGLGDPASDSAENDPTVVNFGEAPEIGLAKAAEVAANSDGSFDVTFTFTAENSGDVRVSDLQMTDDLSSFYTNTDLSPADISVVGSDLSYNTSFDGQLDTNLLTGIDALAAGETKRLILRLAGLRPSGSAALSNQATLTGRSPAGTDLSDISQDGLEPDSNADGDPGNDSEPTPVDLSERVSTGLAKAAEVRVNTDGSFDVNLTFTVANLGNTDLLGVQITDDLTAFYSNTDLSPSNITLAPDDEAELSYNPDFDGRLDLNLLNGNDELQPGETRTLRLLLRALRPTTATTDFSNQAEAEGTSPNGVSASDLSDDGLEPDANGDGDAGGAGEDDPTPISLLETPVVGLAKSAEVVANGDGSFDVDFSFHAENLGNTPLTSLQISDTLEDVYARTDLGPARIILSPEDTAELSYNPSFDGQTDSNLLTGADNLEPGEVKTLVLRLMSVRPAGDPDISNTARAEAQSPGGLSATDLSDDGLDPDPDGDGNPSEAGEDDPTVTRLAERPVVGLAKAAEVRALADGSFDITLTFTLTNLGNVGLTGLQITDDLADLYANTNLSPTDIALSPADAGELAYNLGFDGQSDTNLLSGTGTLAVGETRTLRLLLSGLTPTGRTDLSNSAAASAQSPSGLPATDTSGNGLNPDPDGDGDPGGPGEDEPTPIDLSERSAIGLAKAAEASLNPDGSFDVVFTFTAENLGNTPLGSVQITDTLFFYYSKTDITPADIQVLGGELSFNPGFNGSPDSNLLTGADTLDVGELKTLRLGLSGLRLGEGFISVSNSASASAQSPRGTPASDVSDDGLEPDADGDGDAGGPGESDPSVITVSQAPQIGLAKAATVTPLGDGSFDVEFTFTLSNSGNVNLSGLTLSDSLLDIYAKTDLSPADIGLSSSDAGELDYNAGFDGQTDTALLTGTDTLTAGASKTLRLLLSGLRPVDASVAATNVALVTATAPNGTSVSDESTDGTDADAAGDGPADDDTPTPVTFETGLSLLLDKTAESGPYTLGDLVTYTLTVTNPNAEAVTVTLTDTPAPGLRYEPGSTTITPEEAAPLAGSEPVVTDTGPEWVGVVLGARNSETASNSVSIRYQMRVLPSAETPLLNTASASGVGDSGRVVAAADVAAEVALELGAFNRDEGFLIGRVYLDNNRNDRYDEGVDEPVSEARLLLANGVQTLTDVQGNYAFRDLAADIAGGVWTVQLDPSTASYTPRPHPEAIGNGYLHRVRIQGVTVSDFPLEPSLGLTQAARTTTLRYGPITIIKRLVDTGDTTEVVFTVRTTEAVSGLVILDPQPGGGSLEFRPDLSSGEASFSYALPKGSPLTDPEVRRER